MATQKISSLHTKNLNWLEEMTFIQDEIWCLAAEMDKVYLKSKDHYLERRYEAIQSEFDVIAYLIDAMRYQLQHAENRLAVQAMGGQQLVLDQNPYEPLVQNIRSQFENARTQCRDFLRDVMQQEKTKC